MPKRTLLLVLPWSLDHLGGVNQVVINLARQAIAAGEFEPIVLVSDWNAKRPVREEIDGISVVRWRIRPFFPDLSSKERLAFSVWELSFGRHFHDFCLQNRVAAINTHYPNLNAITLERTLRRRGMRIPLLVSFHGADLTDISRLSSIAIAHWKKVLLNVAGVVVCSRDLGRRLTDIFGNEVRYQIIHNGVDAPAFVGMANHSVVLKGRVILNVAKFEKKKGQDVLIRAFARIAAVNPDVSLVFVGPDAGELSQLKALSADEGIDTRIKFFVDVPHQRVASFIEAATVFCLPSRQEPFGITILEAGCFALPVVASRVGGIPEIISDGIHGRLVTPDDPDELAACIQELLDAPAVAVQMGARLRERIISEFSWTTAYNKYAALMHPAPAAIA